MGKSKSTELLAIDSWIVHRQYGVGKVMAIDTKCIGGEESDYYQLEMEDSMMIWVPIGGYDPGAFRPVADEAEFIEAIAALQRPPKKMDNRFDKRRNRIKMVRQKHTVLSMAQLVRDLIARQREKFALTMVERNALKYFRGALIREWSLCFGIDEDEATDRFLKRLKLE